MIRRHDFDSPWKDIMTKYFKQFMEFFFPAVAEEVDWQRGYTSLDKELRQIAREAEIGARLVDNLFKVWKKNGAETWVLVHVEIQAQEQENFAHRTYVYNYRLHDLYQRPVASFAVLADENPAWRPTEYFQELWGCRTDFRFPVVKILDYAKQQPLLEASRNPFAIVVLAHLKTLATRKNNHHRRRWKVQLTKELYKRGFTKTEILNLYRFIDWIMILPEDLKNRFHQEIRQFEEERKMKYITTAERIGRTAGLKEGIEKGITKGRQEGRQEGRYIGEILIAQRILGLIIYMPEELEQKSLAELKSIFEKMEPKLPASAAPKA